MSDTFDPSVPEEVLEPEAIPEPEPEAPEPDELASALLTLIRQFENEDEAAHQEKFQEALKSEFYWTNRQHTFWNEKANGISIFDVQKSDDHSEDYTINVYRANGESTIAAMSAAVPKVNFYPDDADNPEDLATADAYKRIASLIQKHNQAPLLAIRILFILYNQHFCAVYNYNHKSSKYGTYKKEQYEKTEQVVNHNICSICAAPLEDGAEMCNVCGNPAMPEVVSEVQVFDQLVGYSDEPKSRECLRAFGPLHVRVAPYTQTQEDTPYLILDYEQHYSLARQLYPAYKDKLKKGNASSYADYYRNFRASIYSGECEHLDSWKLVWLRPWAFETFESDDKLYVYLKNNYPSGCKLVFVNDVLVEIEDEDLDDHWTISQNPLSTYIYAEPTGKAALPVQDATNELTNLSMDTVKHGIPQSFADSDTLDFDKYSRSEIAPGMVFPVKVPSNRTLNDVIYTTRTATLSQEVKDVADRLQQFGQLVTGAFPSIYGGVVQGSRTASEYAQSRAQALQRLTNTWTQVKQLWADVHAKACVSFARNMQEDEKEVRKQGSGFINVWIRKAELSGKVGNVEPEIDEQLPTSWAQVRDVLLRLIEMNSPMINEVLADPENSAIIKNALGLVEINIPGYEDRLKQLYEIQDMIAGGIIEVDPLLDNHGIEAGVCRSFLTGEIGRDLKRTNPQAYEMILQHYKIHGMILSQNAMAAQAQNPEQNPAEGADNGGQ